MFRKLLLSAVLIAGSTAAVADPITFSEGFDDITALSGAGWIFANNSTPGGSESWFQGNTGVFGSASGADNSYIAANFNSAPIGGNIDNWLITPVFYIGDQGTISFSTRTNGGLPGDTIELLYSLGGTNFSDFTSIATIGSGSLAFPLDWSTITAYDNGLYADIRFAFRYLVTDTSANGDYIGIDSFQVTNVPEPGTIAMFAAALAMMFVATRRRRSKV